MLMLGALSRALETKYSGGDRHSAENPPHWTTTRLNLPGSIDYDPGISWIKQRPKIQNDGRLWEETGPGEDLTWKSGLVWRYFQYIWGIRTYYCGCTQTPELGPGLLVVEGNSRYLYAGEMPNTW